MTVILIKFSHSIRWSGSECTLKISEPKPRTMSEPESLWSLKAKSKGGSWFLNFSLYFASQSQELHEYSWRECTLKMSEPKPRTISEP